MACFRYIVVNTLYKFDKKNNKTCLLIQIAITDDLDTNTKENEKLGKYEGLEIEVSRM